MIEYFIVANSNAAPFCSDTTTDFINAENPKDALDDFVKKYDHPAGLYAANLYSSSDAYHKHETSILKFMSEKCKRVLKTAKKGD